MALSAEIQVNNDLGIPNRRKRPRNFDKLFEMPPHVTYTAREHKTAARLRRLMGTNVVQMTNSPSMLRLGRRTLDIYKEDLQTRMEERSKKAAAAAHLRLWEDVLRGRCQLPIKKIEDPCMRDIRRQQLKLQRMQYKADQIGTSFQRILSQPKWWSPPSIWKPPKQTQPTESDAEDHCECADDGVLKKSSDGSSRVQETDDSIIHRKNLTAGSKRISCQPLSPQTVHHLSKLFVKLSRVNQLTEDTTHSHQKQNVVGEVDGSRRSSQQTIGTRCKSISPQISRSARSAQRIVPRKPKPVVYPTTSPSSMLLTAEGARHVLGPPTNPDYIIPKYFVPCALEHLRACQNLDELFEVGDALFRQKYPPDDNRHWSDVAEQRRQVRDEA